MLSRGAARLVIALAALVAAAGTARLGVWQFDRAAQKTALQQAITERGALPPLATAELAQDAEQASLQHHRRVQVSGRWLATHTVYLDNRQMDGRPGFYVVTPLQLPDGSALLVQRGWQPRDMVDRSRVAEVPSAAGEVQLLGRIAPPPGRLYEFDASATGRIRQNLDLDAYARETGLALRPLSLLQLDTPAWAADGLKRDWPQPAVDIQRHQGYAFQWFSLCALIMGLYVWFQLIRPWRQRTRR